MIIRSQDKTKIFNFEQIRRINCDNGMIVVDNTALIGEYTTEEKAIKVLDMIMEHYDKVMDARYWNNEYQENFFIMPQDSEV